MLLLARKSLSIWWADMFEKIIRVRLNDFIEIRTHIPNLEIIPRFTTTCLWSYRVLLLYRATEREIYDPPRFPPLCYICAGVCVSTDRLTNRQALLQTQQHQGLYEHQHQRCCHCGRRVLARGGRL